MPTKKKAASATTRALPSIPQEFIDQFVKGPMSAEAIQDASMAFKKALIERAWVPSWVTTLVILRAQSAPKIRPISATVKAVRRCSPTMGRFAWKSPGIERVVSRRS